MYRFMFQFQIKDIMKCTNITNKIILVLDEQYIQNMIQKIWTNILQLGNNLKTTSRPKINIILYIHNIKLKNYQSIIIIIIVIMNNQKGFDQLRGYNPAEVQQGVYEFTKQVQKDRTDLFKKNPHWTGKDSDPFMNKTKQNNRCQKWYDPNYKPIMKRNNLPNTNPIVPNNNVQKAKVEKYFNDPNNFTGSVKRTVLSQRTSNIFNQNQTQVQWKSSVRPIIPKASQNLELTQKIHIKKTEYTTKYNRNPIVLNESQQRQHKRQYVKQRNPITEGQNKDFMQKKGRVTVNQQIIKLA